MDTSTSSCDKVIPPRPISHAFWAFCQPVPFPVKHRYDACDMQSSAKTVTQYLASLPPERKKAIAAVRAVMKKHLPRGYQEGMQYGMICYSVPLSRYPQGYLSQKDVPLPYVALASQKNYMSVYLTGIYGDAKAEQWFTSAWKKSGKKLDMGKSCIRFKTVEDLALDVIGEAVARVSVEAHIKKYEEGRKGKKR